MQFFLPHERIEHYDISVEMGPEEDSSIIKSAIRKAVKMLCDVPPLKSLHLNLVDTKDIVILL